MVTGLPAGRELDSLIAEKVMGLVGVGFYGPSIAGGTRLDYEKCATWEEARALYDKYWEPEFADTYGKEDLEHWSPKWGPLFVSEYSTDIAAAWEVWKKITANKPWQWALYSEPDEKVTVEYYPDGYSGNREKNCGNFAITGLPAPLAICRAALKAMGE